MLIRNGTFSVLNSKMNIKVVVLAVFVEVAIVQSSESTRVNLPLEFPNSRYEVRNRENLPLLLLRNKDARSKYLLWPYEEVPKFFPRDKDSVTRFPPYIEMHVQPLERTIQVNHSPENLKLSNRMKGDLSSSGWLRPRQAGKPKKIIDSSMHGKTFQDYRRIGNSFGSPNENDDVFNNYEERSLGEIPSETSVPNLKTLSTQPKLFNSTLVANDSSVIGKSFSQLEKPVAIPVVGDISGTSNIRQRGSPKYEDTSDSDSSPEESDDDEESDDEIPHFPNHGEYF